MVTILCQEVHAHTHAQTHTRIHQHVLHFLLRSFSMLYSSITTQTLDEGKKNNKKITEI